MTTTDTRARVEELLRRRLAREASTRESEWPLTVGQQAMLYLYESEGRSSAYVLGEAVRLRGPRNDAAFNGAVADLLVRHPILASTVAYRAGTAVQTAGRGLSDVLFREDARDQSDQRRRARLAEVLREPFLLTSAPPLRIVVLDVTEDEIVVAFALHHIAGDFWTLVLLIRDFFALYAARVGGTAADLTPITTTYAEIAAAEQDYLGSPSGKIDGHAWVDALADHSFHTGLVLDPPDAPPTDDEDALVSFALPTDVAESIAVRCRELGCTRFQLLLAAYAVFLRRHGAPAAFTVGVPMTTRLDDAWQDVAGYFINTMPVPIEVPDGATFAQVVERVRRSAAAAFSRQRYPFARLVADVGSSGERGLFDTMFVLRRAHVDGFERVAAMGMGTGGWELPVTDGLVAISESVPRDAAQLPLALSVAEVDGRIECSWEYDREHVARHIVERLADRFAVLVEALVAAPEEQAAAAAILAPGDLENLRTWNPDLSDLASSTTLFDGFREHARRSPDAPAVVCGGVTISYQMLDEVACGVRDSLREAGVSHEEIVAVVMPRTWQMVPALLGTLAAGAAFLPVDLVLPAERVEGMLAAAHVRHVLVHSYADTPRSFRGHVHLVGEDRRGDTTTPDAEVKCGDLAYVIFTSGSTGAPKGVMIEHGAARNTVDDIADRLGLGPNDRVLNISSVGFDLSVFDVFGPLSRGGAVVIPTDDERDDPDAWLRLIRDEAVTVWNSVPALALLLVDAAAPGMLGGLHAALLSGDAVPGDLAARLRVVAPAIQVNALGGATEASIWSNIFGATDSAPSVRNLPYGRPLRGQAYVVLDEERRLVPPGVVGELCIGGAGLARGYWEDPDRTADRFVTLDGIGRVYRTGDAGRHRADGIIEIRGRLDTQVKINGYRVELGEVESALAELDGIAAAVVVAVDVGTGRRLVAFVSGPELNVAALPARLRDRLPGYMVPASFHVVGAFPLSANGKVDRAEIRRLAAQPPATRNDGLETVGDALETVGDALKIVGDALGNEVPLDVGASFLELGGESVAAVRAAMRLRRAGWDARAADLLRAGSLAAFAASLRPVAAPMPTAPIDTTPAATPMQQTMYLHAQSTGNLDLYVEHVTAEFVGDVDPDRMRAAWQEVMTRHDALRARFDLDADGVLRQWFDANVPIVIDVRTANDDDRYAAEVERAKAAGAEHVAWEGRGAPPMAWSLVTLPGRRTTLVWTHHHILIDGWSLGVVMADLRRAYRADPQPAPPGDVTATLVAAAARASARRHEDLAYWSRRLADASPATPVFATTRPREAWQLGVATLSLETEESAAVTAAAVRLAVTTPSLVQAAWALTTASWTASDTAGFELTVAGRDNGADYGEDVVGMLINAVPVLINVDVAEAASAFVCRVHEEALTASEHAGQRLADVERFATHVSGHRDETLTNSLLVFENVDLGRREEWTPGLFLDAVDFIESLGSPCALYVFPGDRLTFRLAFNGATTSREEALQLLGTFRVVLVALARAESDESLARVLGRAAQSRTADVEAAEPSAADDVIDVIRANARRRPGETALDDGRCALTWRELVDAVFGLAAALPAGVEDVVMLRLERSVDLIVAELATLAVGAAWTIAPAEPARFLTRLARVRPAALIVRDPHEDLPTGVRVVDVTARAAARPLRRTPGAAAAYVLFTSGTTGEPNGVVVERRALAAFAAAAAERYRIRPSDRVLQFATHEFDAAIEETIVALIAGASVRVRDEEWTESFDMFLAGVERSGVTVLDLPTAFAAELLRTCAQSSRRLPAAVRLLIVGGEEAPADLPTLWSLVRGRDDAKLINSYGPTETTVVVAAGAIG